MNDVNNAAFAEIDQNLDQNIDQNIDQYADNQNIDQKKTISDMRSHLGASPRKGPPPNKKLSDSRLKLAAIQILPTFVKAEITLKDAIRGIRQSFTVKDQIPCTNCVNVKPVNRLQCPECKGLGYQQVKRDVEIDLPAGLLTDAEIRHPGLGALDFRSGKNGDLVIKIAIIEHPYLKVDGKNVTYNLAVSLYRAVLGGEVEVPTALGKVVMNIQPLTQTGAVYRLKGLGIAGGDQLVIVEVNMPQMLTKEQVQLFQKIEEISAHSNQRNKMALA